MAKRKSPRTATASRPAKRAKRSASKKKKVVVKKRPAKSAAGSAKKASAAKKKASAGKKTVKRKRLAGKRPAALGRPKVPGTAELDQMFLKDYEARQVFVFLGVKTLKELEEHPPEEIVERLTGPLVKTVDRIRKALAVNNRFLAGDQDFAVQFSQQIR